MHTEVDTSQFENHKINVLNMKNRIKSRLEDLTWAFVRLEWDDNFYERVRVALNGHIDEMNRLLSKLEGCITGMGNMGGDLEDYLKYSQ